MNHKSLLSLGTSRFWNGLYLFKLGLFALGYINFSIFLNLLVFLGLCIRFNKKIIQSVYGFLIGTLALMLFYSDSFLPSIDQMIAQKDNLTGFSTSYIIELCISFINFKMVLAFCLSVFFLGILQKYIRIQSIIIILIISSNFLNISRLREGLSYDPTYKVTKVSNEKGDMIGTITNASMDKYLSEFYESQSDKALPEYLDTDAIVDIVIVHADGMTNYDLSDFNTGNNETLGRFNIFLTKFNAVSTDATINTTRLLNSLCGQKRANELESIDEKCNLINNLDRRNFIKRGLFSDKTQYFAFANNFTEKYVNNNTHLSNSDITSTLFNKCIKDLNSQDLKTRSVNYISVAPMHDHKDLSAYKSNVTKFLLQLNNFMDNLQKLNRNILLVFVPAKGDLTPKSFDTIPSRKTLEASVMMKFISSTKTYETIVFDKTTSYISVADLIMKTLNGDYLNNQRFFSVKAFVEDTVVTDFVGEDKNYDYIEPFGKKYFKGTNANWIELTNK